MPSRTRSQTSPSQRLDSVLFGSFASEALTRDPPERFCDFGFIVPVAEHALAFAESLDLQAIELRMYPHPRLRMRLRASIGHRCPWRDRASTLSDRPDTRPASRDGRSTCPGSNVYGAPRGDNGHTSRTAPAHAVGR